MHYIVCPIRPPAEDHGGGNMVVMDKDASAALKRYYTDKEVAIAVATSLATKNPTVQFGVFEPVAILETLTPKVVRKHINDRGEVVLDKKEET